ncbi:hypothetical protein DPMN_157444 [Dreissena polymorpha]|uniref:Uncharacterized protein n=1 Tax=Dreissena polymorpha TaxID=45954 RepID=A0A9D4EI30_DREPO|nr:hypothetical protein DPMN_157444 [Dreissena polymorpha]
MKYRTGNQTIPRFPLKTPSESKCHHHHHCPSHHHHHCPSQRRAPRTQPCGPFFFVGTNNSQSGVCWAGMQR